MIFTAEVWRLITAYLDLSALACITRGNKYLRDIVSLTMNSVRSESRYIAIEALVETSIYDRLMVYYPTMLTWCVHKYIRCAYFAVHHYMDKPYLVTITKTSSGVEPDHYLLVKCLSEPDKQLAYMKLDNHRVTGTPTAVCFYKGHVLVFTHHRVSYYNADMNSGVPLNVHAFKIQDRSIDLPSEFYDLPDRYKQVIRAIGTEDVLYITTESYSTWAFEVNWSRIHAYNSGHLVIGTDLIPRWTTMVERIMDRTLIQSTNRTTSNVIGSREVPFNTHKEVITSKLLIIPDHGEYKSIVRSWLPDRPAEYIVICIDLLLYLVCLYTGDRILIPDLEMLLSVPIRSRISL